MANNVYRLPFLPAGDEGREPPRNPAPGSSDDFPTGFAWGLIFSAPLWATILVVGVLLWRIV